MPIAEVQAAAESYHAMTAVEKKLFRMEAGLPDPPADALGKVWIALLTILAVLAVAAGAMTAYFFSVKIEPASTAFFGITTTIVGGLVGLIAGKATGGTTT